MTDAPACPYCQHRDHYGAPCGHVVRESEPVHHETMGLVAHATICGCGVVCANGDVLRECVPLPAILRKSDQGGAETPR